MSKKQKAAERKLDKLGEHLRGGWRKLYPVTEAEIAKVRKAVEEQWDLDQTAKKAKTESRHKDRDKGPDYEY